MQEPLFTRKRIITLIIPIMIEQLLSTIIGFADTVMVSGAGESAVSAVSLVDSINRMFIFIFAALGTGGTIVASHYMGRREIDNAKRAGKQIFMVTLFISVVVTVVCVLGRKTILSMIYGAVDANVMKDSLVYFLITALTYPAIAQVNTCSALYRATGNSKLPMLVSVFMNIIHIILNVLFIYQLNMGVAGAAISTLIARYVAAAILYYFIQRPRTILNLNGILSYRPDVPMIKSILRVGIPTGFESGMFEIGKLMVLSVIATFGTASITANAVTNSLNGLTYACGIAIGMAMITVSGQYIGAERFAEAKKIMVKMTGWGMLIMLILNIAIILLRKEIVVLYGLTDETAILTMRLIFICCIGTILFWGPAFILPNGLRAAGDVKFTMIVAILSMWTIRVGLGYLLSVIFDLGVSGIWYALVIDWIIRMSSYSWRLFSDRWTKHHVLNES